MGVAIDNNCQDECKVNILVALNDNYMIPLLIMLESLFQHETSPVNLYMFYSDMSSRNLRRLRRLIESRGSQFFPVAVSKCFFTETPVIRYFSKEMYYRLLCGVLLPKHIRRVLYLDPDLLVRGPLLPLYQMKFQGQTIIGVADNAVNNLFPEQKKRLGLSEEDVYFNSGVLLFDLEKMRTEFDLKAFERMTDECREVLSYPDQDMINLYFRGKIREAPRIFNYNTGYGSIRGMIQYLIGKRDGKDPIIVHYMGEPKPWQPSYFGKYFWEYFSFLKKYLNWKGRILFLLKPCYVATALGGALLRRILLLKAEKTQERTI